MENFNLTPNLAPFAVALVTWLGVLFFLFRLEKLTKQVERKVAAAERERETS